MVVNVEAFHPAPGPPIALEQLLQFGQEIRLEPKVADGSALRLGLLDPLAHLPTVVAMEAVTFDDHWSHPEPVEDVLEGDLDRGRSCA